MTTYFAAIDDGNITGAVYGIGESEIGALSDARGMSDGYYTAVPCSPAAAEFVRKYGGAPDARLVVTHDGVTLEAEAPLCAHCHKEPLIPGLNTSFCSEACEDAHRAEHGEDM